MDKLFQKCVNTAEKCCKLKNLQIEIEGREITVIKIKPEEIESEKIYIENRPCRKIRKLLDEANNFLTL